MPAKKKIETDPKTVLDFETVVSEGGTPSAPAVDDNPDEQQTTETHENSVDELAILRAELEATKELLANQKTAESQRPTPEAELTPEQRQIRELQDQLAKANGRSEGTLEYEENVDGGILVHFLSDRTFTSNGTSFYKGQEVTFGPQAYKETLDRFGNSWINLTDDEQVVKWGEVKFRKGPWPGVRKYDAAGLENVSITTQAPVVSI